VRLLLQPFFITYRGIFATLSHTLLFFSTLKISTLNMMRSEALFYLPNRVWKIFYSMHLERILCFRTDIKRIFPGFCDSSKVAAIGKPKKKKKTKTQKMDDYSKKEEELRRREMAMAQAEYERQRKESIREAEKRAEEGKFLP
jgi:hypothetical protein